MTLFGTAFRLGIEPFFFSHAKSDNPQKAYAQKLKSFAEAEGYSISETSYGNKPSYAGVSEAPVFVLELAADREKVTTIGTQIMRSVFGNSADANYDVVP